MGKITPYSEAEAEAIGFEDGAKGAERNNLRSYSILRVVAGPSDIEERKKAYDRGYERGFMEYKDKVIRERMKK